MHEKVVKWIGKELFVLSIRNDLIDFRARNNLTQKELSEKIGVSRDIIIGLEKGTRNIKPVTQRKIEIFLEDGMRNG